MAGRGHARALGGDEVVGLVGRLKLDLVCKYIGKLREELGDFAQALLPTSAGGEGSRSVCGCSTLKSAEASSSLARTCCSVLTLR
jgi:hypothetical protein